MSKVQCPKSKRFRVQTLVYALIVFSFGIAVVVASTQGGKEQSAKGKESTPVPAASPLALSPLPSAALPIRLSPDASARFYNLQVEISIKEANRDKLNAEDRNRNWERGKDGVIVLLPPKN